MEVPVILMESSLLEKNKERYFEVYPVTEIIKSITTQGVYYENSQPRILPCKALEGEDEAVQLNVSEIPPLEKNKITPELQLALSKLGHIMDFGLNYKLSRGFFTRSGYAIIQRPKENHFNKLEHTISFQDGNEFCYATFPDMPVWCRYCHSEGHTKYECGKSKARILCYSCDTYGHMSKDCPSPSRSKKNGPKPFKKQSKINRSSEQVESTDNHSNSKLTPSQEILKPQWAPPKSPTKVDCSTTPTLSIEEKTPFLSTNPFAALIEESKEDDEEQEQEDEKMRGSEYIPESDNKAFSTDEDDDSEEDIHTDEIDTLMRDQEEDIDEVYSNMTCSTQLFVKLITYISFPNQQES